MSKPKVITFKNGAILVYRKDTRNDYSSIRVGFNAGHMVNTHNGIAHFLEHMLFKKTKLHDKDELVEIKEKIIPSLNAFTSIDFMLLDFIRTNKLFSKAMELAAEMLTKNELDEKYIETEKGVIKEEYFISKDKSKDDLNYQHGFILKGENKVLIENSLGTPEDIDGITKEKLEEFKSKFYCLNNLIMFYVGNLSQTKVKRAFKKFFFPNLEQLPNFERQVYKSEITKAPSMQVCENKNNSITIRLSFKFDMLYHDFIKDYNHRFLTKYFNRNKNMLYNVLRSKGLTYSTGTKTVSYENASLFNINIKTSKENIENVLKEINKSLKIVTSSKMSEEELKQMKANYFYNKDETIGSSKSERNDYLIDNIAENDFKKIDFFTDREYKKFVNKPTTQSIYDLARKIFNKNNLPYITFLGNLTEKDVPTYDQICKTIYRGVK